MSTPKVKHAMMVEPDALDTRVTMIDGGHVGEVLWRGQIIARTDPMEEAGDAKAAADAAINRPCGEPDDHADDVEDGGDEE